MEFAFSEQEMICKSAKCVLADVSDSVAVCAAVASQHGCDPSCGSG